MISSGYLGEEKAEMEKPYSRYPTPEITTSKHARGTSCVVLQGRTTETLFLTMFTPPSLLLSLELLLPDLFSLELLSFSSSSAPAMT